MNRFKKLAAVATVAAAVMTLNSASAFAEQRHNDETRRGADRSGDEWRDRRGDASVQRHGDDSRSRAGRDDDRAYRDSAYRDHDRDRERGSYSHGNRQPHYLHGRVTRVDRHRDAYRVWVSNARYPVHVPASHYRRDRFGIGVEIRIGGYYNPAGYYDYYDGDYRRSGYDVRYLRGVVEDIDHRRGTMLLRESDRGRRVRVVIAGRDRTFDRLRRGDYLEVEGDWTRGVFEAYRADLLSSRRDRRW